MYAVVDVTDKRWSDFLSARSRLTEANFWTPPRVGLEPTSRGPTTYSSKWQDQSSELPVDPTPRVGHSAFTAFVLCAYQRHCSITCSRIEPVLEAAHIRPVEDGGIHGVDNGLLLRSDVHKLFDDGYINVDGRFRLRVSPRLKSQFGNEVEFHEQARVGHATSMPAYRKLRPERAALTWHIDTVFKLT